MNWDWDKLQEKRQRQPGAKKPPPSQGPPPPKFPDFGEKFKNFNPFSAFPAGKILVAVAVVAWALSGIFIVSPDEEGIILRFGAYNRSVTPGPHIRLPFPIESHLTPKVTTQQRIEIGVSSSGQATKLVQSEASMLTSDENVVMLQFIVQYRIGERKDDAQKYLFRLVGQRETVKSAAEAAMREVIGLSKIDSALTEGKIAIQNTTREVLQQILDSYDSGIQVQTVQLLDVHPPQDVMPAFRDVASAREEKQQSIELAEAYRNKHIPDAEGEAARIVNEAEGYRETAIRQAEGQSQRFLAVLAEYNQAQDVTRKRMYLEAMEEILKSPGLEKIILPKGTGDRALPLLPLLPGGGKQ